MTLFKRSTRMQKIKLGTAVYRCSVCGHPEIVVPGEPAKKCSLCGGDTVPLSSDSTDKTNPAEKN